MESRQLRWQRKKLAAGLCHLCGKPRIKTSKVYCRKHLLAMRQKNRDRKLLTEARTP